MRFTDLQRRRMGLAVLGSLVAHALVLSLAFSGPGLGTPGLGLNWRDRRAETPDVRVVMVPARLPAAQPPPDAATVQVTSADAMPAPAVSSAPVASTAAAVTVTAAPETASTSTETTQAQGVGLTATAETPPAPPVPEPTSRLGSLAPASTAPAKTPAADKIALDPSRPKEWSVPAEPPMPMPMPMAANAPAPAPSASSAERALPASRAIQSEALARIAPLAPERVVDLGQLDASAQGARRQIEQLQAASAEAGRQDAARREAARQAEALQEAARARAAQADADNARREASRRAMGRQLDEEAARRREAEAAAAMTLPPIASAAARQPAPLPLSWSSARRGRLLGRADPNAELVLYAETFARKIQLNLTIEQVRDAAQQRHTSPLVTVALRQDGSVESVTFVVSSGAPQIDEAIRRIVQGQAPYPAFPPALARDFDVIEIRRTWAFDTAVRLY